MTDKHHGMRNIFALLCFLVPCSGETLPAAILNRPYRQDPLIVGGGGRCTQNNPSFQLATGQLPAGMRLTASGYLEGTPTSVGTYDFSVRVANACNSITRSFSVRVDGRPIFVLSEDSIELDYVVNTPLPAAASFLISSTWNDMPYSAEASGSDWLIISPLAGRTPTSDSPLKGDRVSVSIDPTKLAPGTYRAVIHVTAWDATNQPAITVTLRIHAAEQ